VLFSRGFVAFLFGVGVARMRCARAFSTGTCVCLYICRSSHPIRSLAFLFLCFLSFLLSFYPSLPSSLFWGSFWFWFWLPTLTHLWLRVLPAGTSSGPGHCPCPSDGVVNRRYLCALFHLHPSLFLFLEAVFGVGIGVGDDAGLSLSSLVFRRFRPFFRYFFLSWRGRLIPDWV
jgi:hypothetical protein